MQTPIKKDVYYYLYRVDFAYTIFYSKVNNRSKAKKWSIPFIFLEGHHKLLSSQQDLTWCCYESKLRTNFSNHLNWYYKREYNKGVQKFHKSFSTQDSKSPKRILRKPKFLVTWVHCALNCSTYILSLPNGQLIYLFDLICLLTLWCDWDSLERLQSVSHNITSQSKSS